MLNFRETENVCIICIVSFIKVSPCNLAGEVTGEEFFILMFSALHAAGLRQDGINLLGHSDVKIGKQSVRHKSNA